MKSALESAGTSTIVVANTRGVRQGAPASLQHTPAAQARMRLVHAYSEDDLVRPSAATRCLVTCHNTRWCRRGRFRSHGFVDEHFLRKRLPTERARARFRLTIANRLQEAFVMHRVTTVQRGRRAVRVDRLQANAAFCLAARKVDQYATCQCETVPVGGVPQAA